jgi:Ca2+-binding EF-hand superfamily protein
VPGAASQASTPPPTGPSTTEAKPAAKKLNRFPTGRERLPKGLPDWFLEKDKNGDGQITMAQFTDEWTPEKLAEFARYDLNHDGIITAAECLKVEKAKTAGKTGLSSHREE